MSRGPKPASQCPTCYSPGDLVRQPEGGRRASDYVFRCPRGHEWECPTAEAARHGDWMQRRLPPEPGGKNAYRIGDDV